MLASSTCAVQMFDVAFSRRMCCSRVCRASRSAGRPAVSVLTPTSRPGRARAADSWAAMKAACGPPKPIGTPNRCADPTATSAPRAPGDAPSTQYSGSVATIASPPAACTVDDRPAPVGDRTGRRRQAEQRAEHRAVGERLGQVVDVADDELDADRLGAGGEHGERLRVGVVVDEEPRAGDADSRRAIAIASAAAVASSSSEALATGSPVSSLIIVWKLSSASSRPWLISGLVRRVGRVPRRALEHVAADHRWDEGPGVAHADQARPRPVGGGSLAELVEHLVLAPRRRQVEWLGAADRRRDGLGDEVVERRGADDRQHLGQIDLARPDVAADELGVVEQRVEVEPVGPSDAGWPGRRSAAEVSVLIVRAPGARWSGPHAVIGT